MFLTKVFDTIEETDLKSKFKIDTTDYFRCRECLTGYTSTLVESKFYMTYWELDQFILKQKHLTSLKCKNFNNCFEFYETNKVITDFPQILILNCYTPTTVKYQLSFKFNEIKTKSSYSLFSCVCYKANSCKFLNFFLIGSFLFLIFEFR